MAEILAYAEGYNMKQRNNYEAMEYVIAMGIASSKKGKLLPLFKDEGDKQGNSGSSKTKNITKEQREAELNALKQIRG